MHDKHSDDAWPGSSEIRPLRPHQGLPSPTLQPGTLPMNNEPLSDDARYTFWANRNQSTSIVEPYWIDRGCGRRTLHNRLALPRTLPAYHITIDGRIASSDWEADLPGCEKNWIHIRNALRSVTAVYSLSKDEDVRAACRDACVAIYRLDHDKNANSSDWTRANDCIRKLIPGRLSPLVFPVERVIYTRSSTG